MDMFREAFAAYGAEYEQTEARFMGNKELYLRMLGLMLQQDDLEKLGDALTAHDVTAARHHAHSLKGLAGNMGLVPLHKALDELGAPLRAQDASADYPALYKAVQDEFARVESFYHTLQACAAQ